MKCEVLADDEEPLVAVCHLGEQRPPDGLLALTLAVHEQARQAAPENHKPPSEQL